MLLLLFVVDHNHNWLHFVQYSIISCSIWNPAIPPLKIRLLCDSDVFVVDRLTSSWSIANFGFTETVIQNTINLLSRNLSSFLPLLCIISLFCSPLVAMRKEGPSLAV